MAGKQADGQGQAERKYAPLQASVMKKGGTRRRGMYARTEVTGYTTLSTSASDEQFLQAIAVGATQREYVVWFGVHAESGSVAVFVEKPPYAGAAGITLSRNDKVVSFHLGPVFEQYPDLRPAQRIKPIVTLDKDGGKDCLSIQIKGAPAWRTTSRTSNASKKSESTAKKTEQVPKAEAQAPTPDKNEPQAG